MRTGYSLKDAKAWEATDEQFTFCIDILEISAHEAAADDLVAELEDFFTEMLQESDEFDAILG